jgi:hypothetical protein
MAALLCVRAASAAEETPLDRLAKLADYLSRNDAPQAIACFDPKMKDYGAIEADIAALGAQTDVLCAIDIVSETGTGDERKLDTDWYVELRSQAEGGPVERRRERVQLTMKKFGGNWKITSLSPLSIISPIIIQ